MKSISELSSSNWLRQFFNRLSIRQKIVSGYTLSLGIAVLGTAAGLVMGALYFQAAGAKMLLANQEGSLLSSLQGKLLEVQIDQQEIIPLLSQPQASRSKNSELKAHLHEVEILFSQLEKFSQPNSQHDLQNLLKKYDDDDIKAYSRNLKQLVDQMSLLRSNPEDLAKAQQLIWQFNQSQTAQNFYQYAHELAEFAETVQNRQKEADLAYREASSLQAQVIIVSMVLSVAIAITLAVYTSKIIASPINAVTDVALRVTQEADFELQAPVTTKDEIGTLANALNLLIQQVKHLLEIQELESQTKLIQSEKMSSLGRMLAGVAHEINNPVNFISGNLVYAQRYIDDLLILLKTYKDTIPNPPIQVQTVAEEIDFEFLETDLPKIFNSMTVGTERTREIVRSLKNFSRLDEGTINLVDLHPCIDSTLLILNNRLKHSINVIRTYGEIPQIPGYMGLLYQVFMNILSNAIDALEEKYHSNPQFSPEITIITECLGNDWVIVRIADNGQGITPENKQKIFETFFTTKPRGIGTGLGLAITYQIVVEKHRGKISCNSEVDQGTEFVIALPLNQP
ncbi:HAMP domain-containing protein [Anabaena cylindrica FACHB-243]|uniref:histidine kinase n=1 Tax=Anabaena cylindrica (strain ATCC 27899 / PCC 7122) TaxID=272123 RepID=K9ZLC1_ANACC|nr:MULTISPECIES: ATP-binding protein [Anabaena]AFZ59991.1 integral membrane sensor signal transduction histidine kinase [Anabaena cylindrica PCC 7122]MBD2417951.1 HAMP domain-containing protein [Anabaena cylindrica FACHB-243]MBY5285526.1 HAMP domain-containing protein [Anabaena sp. CCAP 1446/1C]MBY5307031.1 HAMP domain-containing protein [Anabaena sp. CCAP 1446/1C]MCM2404867.1 ATP-binding protein [Anabaena sp. CCAP 1446/1C]